MSCCQVSNAVAPCHVFPVDSKHNAQNFDQELQSCSTQIVTVVRVLLETSTHKGEKSVKSGIIPVPESASPTWQEHGIPSSVVDYLVKKEIYRNSPNRLSKVVEESESFSKREEVQVSLTTLDFLQRAGLKSTEIAQKSIANPKRKSSELPKSTPRKASKDRSLISILLWPLKKLRDGYISCMMSIDGAGDFSCMVQGGHVVTPSRYFQGSPLSKTDAMNYG